ncbi:MAG TPA: carbon-nitrogen hydrolase family protein [Terriglobales bacterium]|nr:carbon-nitrogen hydrolase family protein [Terriglobales bacterium]
MSSVRIALANLRYPGTPEESVALVTAAIADAANKRAELICFPECYVPGYRGLGHHVPPPDAAFLEQAWSTISKSAGESNIAVVLGTERVVDNTPVATALVINRDGTTSGFQDKVQIAPSEEGLYAPGCERRVFELGSLRFGVVICHEGWRYPETVRWAARHGAQIVFHPHYAPAEEGDYIPSTFGDPKNTFHEKAILCRAAENDCYFASVNYACPDSPTTSAIAKPDGTVLCWQPYGNEGLLIADIDLTAATCVLASRYKPVDHQG